MKQTISVFFVVVVLSGCAVTTFELPVAGQGDRIFAVKDNSRERRRSPNVTFVNRSPVWREVAVFDGNFYEDQLLGIGPDGFPMLKVEPIGRFDMGPAESDFCDEDTGLNRKLVRFEYQGQVYTLFIISKTTLGRVVGPFQIVQGQVSTSPMGEEYWYRAWLGPYAGHMVYDVVNDVEYLPDVSVNQYRGTNYILDKTVNVNLLLQRGIRRVRGQDSR